MNRDQMLVALERLGQVLTSRGISANLYVVGKAAIVLAHEGDQLTRDIDSKVDPADEVLAAAGEVAVELDLPQDWLNDRAMAFIPGIEAGAGALVLDRPGITVRAAPADVVLAMKLLAARAKDESDIRLLADMLSLKSGNEVWAVFERYYSPDAFEGTSLLFTGERELALEMVTSIFGPVTGSGEGI